MALIKGINCGFVTVAPTTDPVGSNSGTADSRSIAFKDTSPSGAIKITEIGWYANDATQESNFEVGLYDDDGEPNNRLFVDTTNAKGTDSGWKSVVVDWNISPDTLYWLAFQLDNTTTTTHYDFTPTAFEAHEFDTGETSLTDPWGISTGAANLVSIYAVVETAETGVTRKIKIAGTFQDKPIKTKVAGVFVDKPIKIKIGGTFVDA